MKTSTPNLLPMPGKNANLVKNRPKSDNLKKDDNSSSTSTVESSSVRSSSVGSNSVRSRSPLEQLPRRPTLIDTQSLTLTKTTFSQAGRDSNGATDAKLTVTKTATGQAGNAAASTAPPSSSPTMGDDELIFPRRDGHGDQKDNEEEKGNQSNIAGSGSPSTLKIRPAETGNQPLKTY